MQLKALKSLVNAGVSCHPSVMVSFSPRKSVQSLIQRLRRLNQDLAEENEIEELILYPHVVRRMKKQGLKYYKVDLPNGVPPEQN